MGLRFLIKEVRADVSSEGEVLELQELDIQCLKCLQASTLSQGAGLVDLKGAGVLTCPGCGEHQAISRKRLEDVMVCMRRHPEAGAGRKPD